MYILYCTYTHIHVIFLAQDTFDTSVTNTLCLFFFKTKNGVVFQWKVEQVLLHWQPYFIIVNEPDNLSVIIEFVYVKTWLIG